MVNHWVCGARNLDGLLFPTIDGYKDAINEFTDCLVALMTVPTKGVANGQDIAPIYALEELAKRKLSGQILYRWKASKRDSEGRLYCSQMRIFFWYYKGRIIVLQPQERDLVTYGGDNIYALVNEALIWKRAIDEKDGAK